MCGLATSDNHCYVMTAHRLFAEQIFPALACCIGPVVQSSGCAWANWSATTLAVVAAKLKPVTTVGSGWIADLRHPWLQAPKLALRHVVLAIGTGMQRRTAGAEVVETWLRWLFVSLPAFVAASHHLSQGLKVARSF